MKGTADALSIWFAVSFPDAPTALGPPALGRDWGDCWCTVCCLRDGLGTKPPKAGGETGKKPGAKCCGRCCIAKCWGLGTLGMMRGWNGSNVSFLSLFTVSKCIYSYQEFILGSRNQDILNYAAKSATQTSSLYAKQSSNYFMGRKYYWQQILSYQLKERYRCCTFYSLILIPTETAMKLKSIGQLYCGYHALEKTKVANLKLFS